MHGQGGGATFPEVAPPDPVSMMKVVRLFGILLLSHSCVLSESLQLYTTLPNPADNPDYDRYAVKHPTPATFDSTTKFATLRSFQIDQNSTVVDYSTDLKSYCLDPDTSLGTVIWPVYPLLFTVNFEAVIDSVAKDGLYVTDIWGFVPGSGPGNGSAWRENIWQQFYPPHDALSYLEEKLGEKWLGMDIGEQDGRYIGSYSVEMMPQGQDRKYQFLNFRDHFKGMEDILGPKLVALNSLTFPHYMIKSGLYTLVGAEAAQALPNSQAFYAFIRGAGKQYGVLWFGNVSVYNRFGYKTYPGQGTSPETRTQASKPIQRSGYAVKTPRCHGTSRNYKCQGQGTGGPTCGTSLNLMKRLMYSHIMYGSSYVSFENSWFVGGTSTLSPIGKIQHAARELIDSKGSLGVHVATTALYMDYFSGFCPPRHLYSGDLYRVWGNVPYSEGDYLGDGVLRLMYPQYQDSSYFHNETGFSSPTPYGDTLDVLLSDSPVWTMMEYDTIIVASNLTGESEVRDNLESFVYGGRKLVITAGNVAQMTEGVLGVVTEMNCKFVAAGAKVYLHSGEMLTETYNMTVCDLHFPANCTILAKLADSTPLAVQMPVENGGSLTVFATPFAISSSPVATPSSEVDVTLPSPYPLLDHAQIILHAILTNATLFTSTSNLSLVPSYLHDDTFYLLVSNPELREQPMKLLSPQGSITHVEEVPLDQSEKVAEGYLPDGFEGTDLGNSTNTTIAGGDTRLFMVSLSPDSVHLLPKAVPKPRPVGVALHLRHISRSIRHEILLRPTFFQHYDSVVVDYSYLITKDEVFLMEESQWLKQQNLSVYVDASPSIDLFSKLRLVDNAAFPFKQSIDSILSLMVKMAKLSSSDLILSLHVIPENDITQAQTLAGFNATLHMLLDNASQLGIQLHMQDAIKNPFHDETSLALWMDACGLHSIKVVLNTAILLNQELTSDLEMLISSRSSLLLINAPSFDVVGARYSVNTPLSRADPTVQTQLQTLVKKLCTLRGHCPYNKDSTAMTYPLVLDGSFKNTDEEYLDAKFLENLLYD